MSVNVQNTRETNTDFRSPTLAAGFGLGSPKAPFVVRFLSKARNVKHLNLGCYSSLDDDLLGDMSKYCTFDRLVTCRLAHFRLHDASDIMQLLAPSSASLMHLSLYHMVLRDQETTWADFVMHLASDTELLPALKLLWLQKLFTRTGARLIDSVEGRDEMSFGEEGDLSQWRAEALCHAQGFSESTSGPAWHLGTVAYPFIGMRT